MKSKILILGLILFSASAFGVPDQYDYEYSINVSDLKVENGNLEQRQPQEYSEHIYGLDFTQENTCKDLIVSGELKAPKSVSKVSVSGREIVKSNKNLGQVEISFNDQQKIKKVPGQKKKLVREQDGSTDPTSPNTANYQVNKYDWAEIVENVRTRHYGFSFHPVEEQNNFRLKIDRLESGCVSESRNLSLTFRTYKFWDKFRINSIDAPEITKDQRFNITVNVTNPGNRPTAALLEEPNTIQARFTGLTYPVGSVEKDINLSAGETRIVKIPFSLLTNTEETRLTNRVDIEKKEPIVVQISNQRADIVERKINLTVKDGREPLEDFDFRVKPEKPHPGETFKLEIFTPEDKPITPDGKIQFIKDGEVLEGWKTSRLSSTTNFPSWEELNRTELDNITLKVTLNELEGKISESKRIEIADSKSGWLDAAYSLLFSGDWFIFG